MLLSVIFRILFQNLSIEKSPIIIRMEIEIQHEMLHPTFPEQSAILAHLDPLIPKKYYIKIYIYIYSFFSTLILTYYVHYKY